MAGENWNETCATGLRQSPIDLPSIVDHENHIKNLSLNFNYIGALNHIPIHVANRVVLAKPDEQNKIQFTRFTWANGSEFEYQFL